MTDSNRTWQINPEGLTVEEIAKITGYSPSGLRGWKNKFQVPVVIDGKRDLYMEDGQRLMQQIIEWKEQKKSEPTIFKLLTEQGHAMEFKTPLGDDLPDASDLNQTQQLPELIETAVANALEKQAEFQQNALVEQSKLAELYGKTTYSLGQRDERILTLEREIVKLEDQIKLLPAAVSGLEVEKRELELKVHGLKTELDLEKQRVTDASDSNQTLQEKVIELKAQNRQLQIQVDSHALVQDELKQKITALEKQLSEQQIKAQSDKAASAEELSKVQQDLKIEQSLRNQAEQALEAEKNKGMLKKIFGG